MRHFSFFWFETCCLLIIIFLILKIWLNKTKAEQKQRMTMKTKMKKKKWWWWWIIQWSDGQTDNEWMNEWNSFSIWSTTTTTRIENYCGNGPIIYQFEISQIHSSIQSLLLNYLFIIIICLFVCLFNSNSSRKLSQIIKNLILIYFHDQHRQTNKQTEWQK